MFKASTACGATVEGTGARLGMWRLALHSFTQNIFRAATGCGATVEEGAPASLMWRLALPSFARNMFKTSTACGATDKNKASSATRTGGDAFFHFPLLDRNATVEG